MPLIYRGTPFEERVWRELIAHSLRRDDLLRAACRPHRGARRPARGGRANGMNRIAIVIPCHRVVNADGKLGGYGGGLWRKNWLLELERTTRTT